MRISPLEKRALKDSINECFARGLAAITILTICVIVFVSLGHAQTKKQAGPPLSYSVARTDTTITQVPTTLPVWGPTGLGKQYCPTAWNKICIIRLTDSNTFNDKGQKGSAQSVMDGKENPFSLNDQFIRVASVNGTYKIVTFNPKTMAVGTTPTFIKDGVFSFSYTGQNALQRYNTQVMKLQTTNGWKTYTSTLLYDFANCLPAGMKVTWTSSWEVANTDTVFGTAFSDRGPQGSGEWVAAYKKGLGCSTLNTLTGQVTDYTGKMIGTIDDGINPLSDRFVMHEAAQELDPRFMTVGASDKDNGIGAGGGSGCKAGNCAVNSPYAWEVATTHLRPIGLYNGGGHASSGAPGYINGKDCRFHYWPNPAQPLLKLCKLPDGYDMSGSWNNSYLNTDVPFEVVTALVSNNPEKPFDGPYENEITVFSADGSKAWRLGQTLNGIFETSPYYICQNSHASISPDGNWVLFSSNMGGKGALGYEADGKTSRCDDFLIQVK